MSLPIPFDNPHTYAGHSGVDFPQPRGTVFRASGPGRVTLRRTTPKGGCMIWVEYDELPARAGVGYAHMDSFDGCPPVGERVDEGDQLGHVGNSGHSTGPHLHVEVAGHATTAGFWQFFTAGDVVGGGHAAGGDPHPIPAPPIPAPAPLPVPEEDDMQIKFGHRNEGTDEWMIVHPDLKGPDEKQLGYLVTTDAAEATAWARVYSKGVGSYDFDVNRADYISIQEAARRVATATVRG